MLRTISMLFALFLLSTLLGGCSMTGSTTDKAVSILASGGTFQSPRWSPDGKQIVLLHDSGGVRIEVRDLQGGQVASMRGVGLVQDPGWVQDKIAFLDVLGLSTTRLYVVKPDGPDLVLTIEHWASLNWDHNGRFAAMMNSEAAPGGGQVTFLHVLDMTTGKTRAVWTETPVYEARISLSGRYIAFVDKEPSAYRLRVMDLQTGKARQLWQVPYPGDGFMGLTWSPDEQFVGVRRTGGEKGYYILDAQGSIPPYSITKMDLVYPDWSPVGDRIVFATVGVPGSNDLAVLQLPPDWREKLKQPH